VLRKKRFKLYWLRAGKSLNITYQVYLLLVKLQIPEISVEKIIIIILKNCHFCYVIRSMDVAFFINSYFSATAIIQNYFVN